MAVKWISTILCVLAICLYTEPTIAGSANSGTITQTVSFPTGQFLFYQNGTRISQPACAVSNGRWAVDVTTGGGQAAEANILTAYALGHTVMWMGRAHAQSIPQARRSCM